MKKIQSLYRSIFFTTRLYCMVGLNIALFVMAYFYSFLYDPAMIFLWIIIALTFLDLLLLFGNKYGISASRQAHAKLSNGDNNDIHISVHSFYRFAVFSDIIDELPEQFQSRKFNIRKKLESEQKIRLKYTVRPTSRGEYEFGNINVSVRSVLGITQRLFSIEQKQTLACYPSFLKLRQYELMAISDRLTDLGIKKIRKIGSSAEFDNIKEYVTGNDIRTINWKATARKSTLMVNHYRDERAQQVYSVIDMGRIMKMPFEELSLLDYSINAALVLSHVSYIKHDKPGLIGFSGYINTSVTADRKGNQLTRIQEALYNAKTGFDESNYETLLSFVRAKVKQRSLLLLYTNFETLTGLKRQLKYIRQLSKHHLVVVIMFQNTELDKLLQKNAENTYEIYTQTIARKFDYEKRLAVLELQKAGIQCVYTKPSELTVNTLNKYLELKARGMI